MPKRPRPDEKPKRLGAGVGALLGAGAVLAAWAVLGRSTEPVPRAEPAAAPIAGPAPAAAPVPRAGSPVPPGTGPRVESWDPGWDPLPARNPALAEAARDVYTFAAHRPDVVRHIPCFCGCSRSGHTSVESCFVTERDENGRPKWNPMGVG